MLLKVSSNGRPDYVRVLPSVRDRQLKLLITEKPDWRNGEQLSRSLRLAAETAEEREATLEELRAAEQEIGS